MEPSCDKFLFVNRIALWTENFSNMTHVDSDKLPLNRNDQIKNIIDWATSNIGDVPNKVQSMLSEYGSHHLAWGSGVYTTCAYQFVPMTNECCNDDVFIQFFEFPCLSYCHQILNFMGHSFNGMLILLL